MKKVVSIFLGLVVLLSSMCAEAVSFASQAKALYDLGLLKGTGEAFSIEWLEADRCATRTEICITVVRMLGREEKAHYQANPHPFGDVPQWASDYIGWLYENYLVNGMGDTYFGAGETATMAQFATMLLRVLGYDDSVGDFSYENAVNFAKEKGLLPATAAADGALLRRDMIEMCYRALQTNINNSARPLIRKLCEEGAVSKLTAETSGILKKKTISDAFPDVPSTLGTISAKKTAEGITLKLDKEAENYGLRIFMMEENSSALHEIKQSGAVYFQKGKIEYYGGSAGYVSELNIYGLDKAKKYSFIVLKTSSEGELYLTIGKSEPCEI